MNVTLILMLLLLVIMSCPVVNNRQRYCCNIIFIFIFWVGSYIRGGLLLQTSTKKWGLILEGVLY